MQTIPKTLPGFFCWCMRPFKAAFIGLLLIGFIWAIQNSLNPYLLKMIIDRLSNYQGDKSQIVGLIMYPAIGYVCLWLLMAFIYRMADWIKLKTFPHVRANIGMMMFKYLNLHSYSYLIDNFSGNQSNKIMDMTSATIEVFIRLEEMAANILAFLVALVALGIVHPVFALILFTWFLMFAGITIYFSKQTKVLSHIFSESRSKFSGRLIDCITNILNIRLFARNQFELQNLDNDLDDMVQKDKNMQWYILKLRIFWDISFMFLIGGMLGSLIYLYSKGKLTVGDFAFIMTVSVNMFMFIWWIVSQFVHFTEDLGRCSQALEILKTPHDITDKQNAKDLIITQGQIQFKDVDFAYAKEKAVFKNKNITIEAQSKVGLVGFSGSGKSTFVNLILRFFELQSGTISIDGQNIQDISQDSLRRNISMIPQDSILFHRTMLDNIRYGNVTASDREVKSAAQKANCHEFIQNLPQGYNTIVGERGIKLSGGQRQRIAIARAFLKNAKILMLDEATSSLDSITEKYIQKTLQELMHNKTTIIIAHRLSTLANMDRILVFDKGQIIEDGSHQELLNKKGHYAKMWQMQAGGFLPDDEDV